MAPRHYVGPSITTGLSGSGWARYCVLVRGVLKFQYLTCTKTKTMLFSLAISRSWLHIIQISNRRRMRGWGNENSRPFFSLISPSLFNVTSLPPPLSLCPYLNRDRLFLRNIIIAPLRGRIVPLQAHGL